MMYCRDIKVFALEPHTSHWGQPLDKNPFLAFKDAFNEGMHKFNRKVGGRSIQKSEFFSVFNVAWEKSMTSKNIKAGYKRTGIWPVNRAAIPSYIIEPSKICKSKVVLNCNVFYCISLDWIVFCFSLTTIKMIWYMCISSVMQPVKTTPPAPAKKKPAKTPKSASAAVPGTSTEEEKSGK